MPITYLPKTNSFHLQTPNSSYIIHLAQGKIPLLLHYGKRVDDPSSLPEIYTNAGGFSALDTVMQEQSPWWTSSGAPLELAIGGGVDRRQPALDLTCADGISYFLPFYRSHKIYAGKPKLKGLPTTYAAEDEATTLELLLSDEERHVEFLLRYTVFEALDVITRSMELRNQRNDALQIKRALSMSFDLPDRDFDLIHLHGGWARERSVERSPQMHGAQLIESTRGASSHAASPFLALAKKNATETEGSVYGVSLLYSGNFVIGTDTAYSYTRVLAGINPRDFSWTLDAGESFVTPEVVLTYSSEGLGGMSRAFHDLARTHLLRGPYQYGRRPILLNNWEATYFDFDEEKILALADKAKQADIELLVLDDGWFGCRDDSTNSLGDWTPFARKLPNGIVGLAEKIEAKGLKFGLWYEPEMISPDSELYRAHPDWALEVPGKITNLCRNQLILDLTRDDVCDYIKGFLCQMLTDAKISYIKWDMNRNFSEVYSHKLPADRMGELAHRYMCNLYDILETVTQKFPNVLFEGCSGGGGRFDLGMLPYFPQYWCSDDTDAVERLSIQYGSSMFLPTVSIGSHVSIVPNHQSGRITPLSTRGNVAMCGSFGYELDLMQLSDEELAEIAEQVKTFRSVRDVIHHGDLYRLESPFDGEYSFVSYVAKDKSEAVALYANTLGHPNSAPHRIRFAGLDPKAIYQEVNYGWQYSGSVLMHIGLVAQDNRDFQSTLYHLRRIDG